jgi:hypothetical protein
MILNTDDTKIAGLCQRCPTSTMERSITIRGASTLRTGLSKLVNFNVSRSTRNLWRID